MTSKRRGPFETNVQSNDKSITGFKVISANGPKKETKPFASANYPVLIKPGEKTNIALQEVAAAVLAVKEELPNTRKRLAKNTYRNVLVYKNRNDIFTIQESNSLTSDPFKIEKNRVAESLRQSQTQ